MINQLCDISLVYAYAEQVKKISVEIVQRVLQDRGKRGAIPLYGSNGAPPPRASIAAADFRSERG